ncbi:MAG: OmpA family protein [Bacteroidota bacterium]
MMTQQRLFTLMLLLASSAICVAQGDPLPEETTTTDPVETVAETSADKSDMRPKDMIEFGLRPTYVWVGGDVTAETGYGAGIHLRKSLDYVFSIRLDGMYGIANGDNGDKDDVSNRNFDQTWLSGSLMGVMSLNSFRNKPGRKSVNIYAMAGAGANFFETNFNGLSNGGDRDDQIEQELAAHIAAGAGIAFRLGGGVNIGLEYLGQIPVGSRADLLDGYSVGGNFRDIQNAVSLSLNFNIGNKSNRSEPLWWLSPLDPIRDEMSGFNQRINDATNDSDGDGVVDAIDQEPNTPSNVAVDTRGRTLDSDKDGVPDFRDAEPFFPPRPGEEVDENGVVTNRIDQQLTEEQVQQMINEAIDARLSQFQDSQSGGGLREMYLPMIYFPLNQATVKYSDYGTLASIARVMRENPDLRLVVKGFTDRIGNEQANERLSYRRAQAVIEHLVSQHGISRSRLVLQYGGENENLVPQEQTYVNRRVEFFVAQPGDNEMAAPAGVDNGGRGY